MTTASQPTETSKPPLAIAPVPPKSETKWVALDAIVESPFNPRKDFPAEGIAELAASIRERGLLENLVVRPPLQKGGKFELMAGHRRLRALKLNKAEGCACTVIEADDGQARATLIVENLQREDLGPMEEAEAFDQLNKADPAKWTPQTIAAAIGKTDRFVQQRLALHRNLAPEVLQLMKKGGIKIETLRVLAGAPQKLQAKAIENKWGMERVEASTMRETLLKMAVPQSAAAFDVALYDGEWIEDGNKRYFGDVPRFMKLQRVVARAKVEALKAEWPTAAFVSSISPYRWADDGNGLQWSNRQSGKAKGKFKIAKEKCTAIVYIDSDKKIRSAEGVALKPPERATPSTRSEPRYEETPARKATREAFNQEVGVAYAKHSSAPMRLLLLDLVTGDSNINISPAIRKLALPGIDFKKSWLDDDDKAKIWPHFAALKDAAVAKAFLEIGRAVVDVNDQWSDFAWAAHEKTCPPLIAALGKTLGVSPEADEVSPAKKTPDAKPAAKKKVARKAATKKKHQ